MFQISPKLNTYLYCQFGPFREIYSSPNLIWEKFGITVTSSGLILITGSNLGGNIRLVEKYLGRPLTWSICLLHQNELFFKEYFRYCDYEGKKKEKNKSPKFNGHIGKLFRDGLDLKPIVDFDQIDGKVENYDAAFIKSLNNDSKYFYEICQAIITGNFPDELVYKIVGHVHQARWITCASNILRLYCQTTDPSIWLIKMVHFILDIYVPNFFNIKKNPNITNGSRHLFTMFTNAETLLQYNEDEYDIIKKVLLNNSYFMHVEHIIMGLLTDDNIANRGIGKMLIITARNQYKPLPNNEVRPFLKLQPHQVNWNSPSYFEFLDYDSLPEITEPNLTMDLTLVQLDEIVNGTLDFIKLCYLENTYCHTQNVERNVANTTLAAKTVIGQEKRHGFLLLLKQTRNRFNGRPTKQHFIDFALNGN